MAKDEQFLVFILIITLLDFASSKLSLSQRTMTKNIDETFMVICKDDAGQSVIWKGPRGTLTLKSRPSIQHGAFGTAIYFSKAKIDDTGNYTCMLSNAHNVTELFSLKVLDNLPPTSTESEHLTLDPIDTDIEDKDDYYEPIITTTTEIITSTEIVAQTNTESNVKDIETTTEDKQITTVHIPTQTPVETPAETPVETTLKTPVDTSVDTPVDKPIHSPVENRRPNYHKHPNRIDQNVHHKKGGHKKEKEQLDFKDTPETQTATEGRNFTLLCRTNLRDAQISWSLASGGPIDGKRCRPVSRGLFFPKVSREDAQVYQCQAFLLDRGNIIGQNITLDVHHKPSLPYEVYAEEEEVYAFLNEVVNLTCEVEANPPPKFKWHDRKMGKILTISSHISVLELNVTDETPGTYQCTAYNKEGKLEKYFDVQLGEHPEMPTNIELLEATTDSLQIKVEVPDIPHEIRDPVMDPQWLVVEYKPLSENEWYSAEFNITSETIVLTGLSKKTKYEIQAATKNIAGLSEYYFNNTIFETSPAISVHSKSPIVIYFSITLISMFWIA